MPTDERRLDAVRAAFDEGWGDRLALSQDVCLKSQLRVHGGPGYAHLLATVALGPLLLLQGAPSLVCTL